MKSTLIMVAVLLAAIFSTAADEPQKPKLQAADAQKIAVAKVQGTVENQDTLVIGGQTSYSFDIQAKKELREVVVNGDTGKILSNKVETADDVAAKKKKKVGAVMTPGTTATAGTTITH